MNNTLFFILMLTTLTIKAQNIQEKNKEVVRTFMEEILEATGIEKYNEFHAPDFVVHTSDGRTFSVKEDYEFAKDNLKGVPDLTFVVTRLIAEKDFVVAHWKATGTITGSNRIIKEPTGQIFEVEGITIYRLYRGKIAEEWTLTNMLHVLLKLGLLPAR